MGVCGLAGLWMTSAHLALVVGGIRGLASPGAVVLHALPGPLIAALATSLVVGSVRVVERESLWTIVSVESSGELYVMAEFDREATGARATSFSSSSADRVSRSSSA